MTHPTPDMDDRDVIICAGCGREESAMGDVAVYDDPTDPQGFVVCHVDCEPPPTAVVVAIEEAPRDRDGRRPHLGDLTMDRMRYRAEVELAVRLARSWQAEEPSMVGERLVAELHEDLNAPDSFFTRGTDERHTEQVALDVLRWSDNRHAAVQGGRPSDGIASSGGISYEYLAAWAFVYDVLDALQEDATTPA